MKVASLVRERSLGLPGSQSSDSVAPMKRNSCPGGNSFFLSSISVTLIFSVEYPCSRAADHKVKRKRLTSVERVGEKSHKPKLQCSEVVMLPNVYSVVDSVDSGEHYRMPYSYCSFVSQLK